MTRRRRGLAALAAVVLGLCAGCTSADPGYGGRSTAEWITSLDRADVESRAEAVDALGRVLAINPRQADAVRALIRALDDTSDVVRVGAALSLAKEGVRAEGAVPALAAVARDSAHPRVRRIALETLGRLTHSLPANDADAIATPIAIAVGTALNDSDRAVRHAALGALGGLRGAAGAAAPALAPRLFAITHEDDPDLRIAALAALAALPVPVGQLVDSTTRMLGDSAARVRVAAAGMLERMGGRAAAAVPALVLALSDRDPDVRRAAAVALGYAMPAGAVAASSALERARRDPDAAVRREAEHARTRFHVRGGADPPLPEPSRQALCRASPTRPGC